MPIGEEAGQGQNNGFGLLSLRGHHLMVVILFLDQRLQGIIPHPQEPEVTHPHQPQVTNPNAYLQPNSFHKTFRKKQLDKNHRLNEQTNRPRKEMLTH